MLLNSTEIQKIGIETISLESESLKKLSGLLTESFSEVVQEILNSSGRVVVTGIGKSAIIGQKMVATFNSTGTPSLFMHAADAIHGDLGMVQKDDIVICISKSGNSPEIKALAPLILRAGNKLVGVVGNLDSFLATTSDFILDTSVDKEACPNNLAPTTSTVAQMAMGDALAVALIKCRDFRSEDFAKYHPGGALGKRLYLTLSDIAKENKLPQVSSDESLTNCILAITKGRLGIVVVVDKDEIKGIITDGDLRRMITQEISLSEVVASDIMTKNPKVVLGDMLAIDAVNFVKEHKINHLILANENKLEGIVHIQDLIREGLI
ncbi:MAG: KpsF/GutQ family sugar-phosphate isomerase [Bacteroidia bacterium]